VLVDISAQEEAEERHCLHTEMSLVSVKFERNSDSTKTQLDIGSIAVDDTLPGSEGGSG